MALGLVHVCMALQAILSFSLQISCSEQNLIWYQQQMADGRQQSSTRQFTCPHCTATFNRVQAMKNHVQSHKPRRCKYCGDHIYRTAECSASLLLRNHELSCQRKITRELMPKKGVKTYRCVTCCTDFNKPYEFERHSCFMECIHCKEKLKHMRKVNHHKCPSRLLKPNEFQNLKSLQIKYK